MKKLKSLLLTLILLSSLQVFCQTHEILRPTTDVDTQSSPVGSCTTTSVVESPSNAMPNAYDASGTSTGGPSQGAVATSTTGQQVGRKFSGWSNSANVYSSLTLNVNSECFLTAGGGQCGIYYSLDSGTTYITLKQDLSSIGWNPVTSSATLSTSQQLSQIRVAYCMDALAPSNSASITIFDIWTDGVIATIPSAPSGLSASVANGIVTLSWTDNSTNETGFKIDKCVGTSATCTSDSVASLLLTTGSNVTSNGLGGLTGKTAYTFFVKATNAAGDSAATSGVTVFLPGASVHHVTSP